MDDLCYRLLDKDTKMMFWDHAWLMNIVLFPEIPLLPAFIEQVLSSCAFGILMDCPALGQALALL